MADYTKGKIYKIIPDNQENVEDVYIGSTTKEYLSQRMATHKTGYYNWKKTGERYISSYILFDKYGIENCKIILIENVSCKSKDELVSIENKYIHDIQCINLIGRKSHEKEERKIFRDEMNKKANEYDEIIEEKSNKTLKKKNRAYEVDEKKLAHLAQARIKAAETKRANKELRIKAENLGKLKLELKAKEYDEI